MDNQLTPEQEYNRAYYQKNKAKYKKRYAKNKRKMNAQTVQRRKDNPEPYSEYQRQWRANNPDKCKGYRAHRNEKEWANFVKEIKKDKQMETKPKRNQSEYSKAWRAKNPHKQKEYHAKRDEKAWADFIHKLVKETNGLHNR